MLPPLLQSNNIHNPAERVPIDRRSHAALPSVAMLEFGAICDDGDHTLSDVPRSREVRRGHRHPLHYLSLLQPWSCSKGLFLHSHEVPVNLLQWPHCQRSQVLQTTVPSQPNRTDHWHEDLLTLTNSRWSASKRTVHGIMRQILTIPMPMLPGMHMLTS